MASPRGSSEPRTRPLLGVVAGLVLALIGAVLLGEQPLEGTTAFVAGALFGVAIGEAMVSVARGGDAYLSASAALLTEAGLVWALYIETGHDLRAAVPEAWAAVVVGAVLAALWVRTGARRGRRSPAS